MSYILEALKKAESERKLGSVPDMNAHPLAATAAAGSSLWTKPIAGVMLASIVLAAVIIAQWAPWHTDRLSDAGSGTTQEAAPPAAAPNAASPPAAQASVPEAVPLPPQQAVPAAPPELARQKAEPKPRPAKKKKSESAAMPAASTLEEKTKESAVPVVAAASAAEPRLPGFRDLPENIQREIPALTVGGYIYSSVPAERSVLINNRLMREGSEVTHGLVLEKMLPKEVVFNYKGYRYRVPYQ